VGVLQYIPGFRSKSKNTWPPSSATMNPVIL